MKARLLGQHFPYATYEITLDALPSDGFSGLGVRIMASGEDGSAYDRTSEPCLYVQAAQTEAGKMRLIKKTSVGGVTISEETTETAIEYASGMSLIVTSRGMFFDVYLKTGALPVYICTYEAPEFKHILKYDTFVRSTASLLVSLAPGAAAQGAAEFYLEGGVSHADMKCMQYENGMPIMKDGKLRAIYLKDDIAGFAFHLLQK